MIYSSKTWIPLCFSIVFSPVLTGIIHAQDCDPPCRSGYECKDGTCVSACNPPCPENETCDPKTHDCLPIAPVSNGSERKLASNPWSEITVSANPLGFLTCGPTVTLEVKTVSTLYITGTFGWFGAGLVPNLLISDLQPNSLFGYFGLRYYFQNENSSGAAYAGVKYLIGYENEFSRNVLDDSTQVFSNKYVLADYQGGIAEGGYRWRFGRFLLSVGGVVGYGGTFYDQCWYSDKPSAKYDNTPINVPWVEVVLGLGFGIF